MEPAGQPGPNSDRNTDDDSELREKIKAKSQRERERERERESSSVREAGCTGAAVRSGAGEHTERSSRGSNKLCPGSASSSCFFVRVRLGLHRGNSESRFCRRNPETRSRCETN
ncbi:hypothetical protein Q5P01_015587 [Channa striata]|uniref:Uncharacterized protein n=1 Tax=Channa striata TaxID=64152 RepID=A0AA88MCL9_CHASR|nr:hypothetical protein Q5P01_015587 [Channa striata]